MLDGLLTPALRDINYLAPCAPYPMTPSGITIHENTIYRYAIPTDEQPVLSIIDYIPDYNGNFINPGHYQLALSDDKEFLYLIESKNLIAVIPVFKLAEDESELIVYSNGKQVLTTGALVSVVNGVVSRTIVDFNEDINLFSSYVNNGTFVVNVRSGARAGKNIMNFDGEYVFDRALLRQKHPKPS